MAVFDIIQVLTRIYVGSIYIDGLAWWMSDFQRMEMQLALQKVTLIPAYVATSFFLYVIPEGEPLIIFAFCLQTVRGYLRTHYVTVVLYELDFTLAVSLFGRYYQEQAYLFDTEISSRPIL